MEEKTMQNAAESGGKKAYEAPELKEHGALQRMTKGGTFSNNDHTTPASGLH